MDSIEWYNNYNREQPSTSKEVHCRPPEELCKSEKIDTDGRIEIDQSLTSKEIPKKTCVTSVKEDPGSDDVICLIDEDEEAVERYHEEAKQALHYLLSLESENENKFIDVIEKYKVTLESQVELLSGKYLKEVIIKDLMFITINYQRIAVAYIEKYLDIMEEILVYFCDVIRNYFKDQKKFKLKIVIKMESRKIKILLRDCLLNRFDRIMHVLMRVKIAMEMQEHRILWTDIYRYYLARVFKYRHHDDILRGFIIFQRLKEIRPKEEAEKIELFMLKTYRKTKNELRKIPVLREILDKMENDPLYSVRDMCVHYNRYYKRKNEDMFLEVDNQQSPCEVKSFSKTWRMNFDVTRLVLPTLYSSQSCFGHVLSERKQGERKSVLELAGFFSSNDHLRSFDNELFHLDDGKQRKSKSIKKEPGSKNSSVIVVDDESDEDDIVLVSDDLENIAISNEASKAQPPKGVLVPTIQVPIEGSPGNKNVEDSMQLTESLSQVSALPETVSLPSKELMPQTQEPTMVPNQITSIEETMPQIELVDKNMPKMLPICLRSSSETPGESLSLDEPTLTEESQEIASNLRESPRYMKSLPPKTGLPPNLPEEIDKPLEPVEKQNPTNRNILVSNNQGLTHGKSIISFEDEINKEKEKSASYCETSKDLLTSSDSVSLVKYNSASKLISVNGDVQVSSKICESEIADNLGSNKKVNSLSEKLSSEKIEKTTSEKVLSQFPSNQETEKLESKKDILQHPEETTETASSENKDLNLLQRENHLVKEISSSLPLENLPSITADGLLKKKPSSAVNSNTAAERVLTSSILEQHEENSQKTREDCCKLITGNDGLSQRSLKEEDISSKINGESTSKITETVSTDNSQATNENEPNSPHYEALDEKEVQIYFSARKNEINPELEGRVTPLVINESTSASLPKENLNEENKTIQPNIAQNTLDCTSISVEEKSNIDVTLQIESDSNVLDIKPNETQNMLYDNASKIQNYPNITEFYTNFADEVSLDDNKSIDNLCADQDLSFALSEKTFVQTIELLSGEELTVSANESLVLSDDTITIRVATINAAKEEDIPLEYSEGQIAPYLGNTTELNNSRDSSNNEILSPVENIECNKKAKDEELAQLNEALLPLHPNSQSVRRGAIDCQLPLSGSQPYTPQTSPNSRVDMVVPEASSILLSDTKDNDNIGAEKIFETASSEETINSATSLQNLFPMETNSFKVKLSLGRCGNVLENILNSSKKNQSIKRSISSEDCTIAHKPIKRYKETDKPFVEDLPQSLAITNSENSQPVKSTEEKCRLSEVKKSVHLESDKIVPLKHSEEYLVEYSQQKTDASQQNDYVVDYSNEKFPENIKKRGTKERVEESSQYLRIKGATQLPYSQENSILDTASKQNKTRNRCEPKEVFHKVSHSSLEYPSQMVPLSFTSGYMSQQSTNELPQEKSDEDLISYDSNELFNNGIEGPLDKPLRYSKNPMDNWSWWNDDTGSGSFMDEIRSSREIPIVTENQLGQNKKPQPENLVSCLKSSKEKIGNKSSTSRKTEAKKKVTFEDETVTKKQKALAGRMMQKIQMSQQSTQIVYCMYSEKKQERPVNNHFKLNSQPSIKGNNNKQQSHMNHRNTQRNIGKRKKRDFESGPDVTIPKKKIVHRSELSVNQQKNRFLNGHQTAENKHEETIFLKSPQDAIPPLNNITGRKGRISKQSQSSCFPNAKVVAIRNDINQILPDRFETTKSGRPKKKPIIDYEDVTKSHFNN